MRPVKPQRALVPQYILICPFHSPIHVPKLAGLTAPSYLSRLHEEFFFATYWPLIWLRRRLTLPDLLIESILPELAIRMLLLLWITGAQDQWNNRVLFIPQSFPSLSPPLSCCLVVAKLLYLLLFPSISSDLCFKTWEKSKRGQVSTTCQRRLNVNSITWPRINPFIQPVFSSSHFNAYCSAQIVGGPYSDPDTSLLLTNISQLTYLFLTVEGTFEGALVPDLILTLNLLKQRMHPVGAAAFNFWSFSSFGHQLPEVTVNLSNGNRFWELKFKINGRPIVETP